MPTHSTETFPHFEIDQLQQLQVPSIQDKRQARSAEYDWPLNQLCNVHKTAQRDVAKPLDQARCGPVDPAG